MIVIFDSNIWFSELGLRSSSGAAIRFYLRHSGARVAIPEVIRLEVEHNLRSRLAKHIENIQSDYRQLLTAFGTLHEMRLPGPAEVEARVNELFVSLNVEQFEVPFTLESARSSLMKTIHKDPPSHGAQQFKDGVIWADCLKLLEQDEVVLVTNDKAFYQDQQYSKGLVKELVAETAGRPHVFRLLHELSGLLDAVKLPVPMDADALQAAFLAAHRDSVIGTLDRQGFTLGPRTSSNCKLFATDNPASLFIEFGMTFSCSDVRGQCRTEAELHLKGDGTFSPQDATFSELRNFGEHLTFRNSDGSLGETRNSVVYAEGIVLGHRQVARQTRVPLAE